MRLKFVIVLLLLVSGLGAVVWLVRPTAPPGSSAPAASGDATPSNSKPSSPAAVAQAPAPAPAADAPQASAAANAPAPSNAAPAIAPGSDAPPLGATEAEQKAYVRRRTLELYSLAMNDDTTSRDRILAELGNADPRIRHAALEAAIQFNDRSVVPYLKEVAERTSDAREKVAILDAIDYINLPSLSEYLEQRKALGPPNNPPPRPRAK